LAQQKDGGSVPKMASVTVLRLVHMTDVLLAFVSEQEKAPAMAKLKVPPSAWAKGGMLASLSALTMARAMDPMWVHPMGRLMDCLLAL